VKVITLHSTFSLSLDCPVPDDEAPPVTPLESVVPLAPASATLFNELVTVVITGVGSGLIAKKAISR
jgi:hypothetical protein